MQDQVSYTENSSWWLKLTAPKGAQNYTEAENKKERDRLRKAGLISGVAPFIFFSPLLLSGQANDSGTITAIAICMLASVLAIVLNRLGKQTIAAILLILAVDAAIENALLRAPGGLGTAWLLTFDLFLFPLILPGMLLSRRYIWFFLTLHVALIMGDFLLLPHTSDLNALIQQWGSSIAFARPLILEVGIGLLCFYQIRSTDQAINRADRAEEIAALEHEIADQKKQLEVDIQKLSETLSQAANGHFIVRADVQRGNILWGLASQMNTLLARLQTSRQSDTMLRQTQAEISRLAETIRAANQGQRVVWPLPSGGLTDILIKELRDTPGSPTQIPPKRG